MTGYIRIAPECDRILDYTKERTLYSSDGSWIGSVYFEAMRSINQWIVYSNTFLGGAYPCIDSAIEGAHSAYIDQIQENGLYTNEVL